MGALEQAMADFNKAIQLDPKLDTAYTNRGLVFFKLGQYDQAIVDYSQAIFFQIQILLKAYSNRGSVYLRLVQYDNALVDFNQAIQINPEFAEGYYNRGVVYKKLSKTVEAEADFKKYEELTGQKP